MHQPEVLFGTHAVAAGDNDARTLDVDLALLDLTVDDLHREVRVRDHLLPVDRLHLARAGLCGVLLAHHALADGRHLGTVVGVHDRRNDVAAEGRANLVQQILILRTGFRVLMVADHQLRTVGRQTTEQRRRYARSEIAADGSRTEKGDLGLLLLDQTAHHSRMGQRAERSELLAVGRPHGIGAVFGQLLSDVAQIMTQYDGFELHAERRGQLTAFGQQLQTHVRRYPVFEFYIYKYIIHISFPP